MINIPLKAFHLPQKPLTTLFKLEMFRLGQSAMWHEDVVNIDQADLFARWLKEGLAHPTNQYNLKEVFEPRKTLRCGVALLSNDIHGIFQLEINPEQIPNRLGA